MKGVITSLFPTTLVDVDTGEVKKTYQYHKHCVIRQEFLDLDLALIWEDEEGAPVYPTMWVVQYILEGNISEKDKSYPELNKDI